MDSRPGPADSRCLPRVHYIDSRARAAALRAGDKTGGDCPGFAMAPGHKSGLSPSPRRVRPQALRAAGEQRQAIERDR